MENEAAAAFMMMFGAVSLIIGAIFIVLSIVSMWKIFKKAGREGWKSIIPIYNGFVMLEIAGYPGWLIFLAMIPFVNFIAAPVISIMSLYGLVKNFRKPGWHVLLAIFFNVFYMLYLAFSDASYEPIQTVDNMNNEVVQ